MPSPSGDPHEIEVALVDTEEYQAPPRGMQEGRGEQEGSETSTDHPADPAGQPIDINLLEAQQQRPDPQIPEPVLRSSEPTVVAPSQRKDFTVSGPDEETQPGGPRAVPPGESM